MFEPWQLAMIDEAGYNGITDDHIKRVAESIEEAGNPNIDYDSFKSHCYCCGIDPDNFTNEDLDRLEKYLNR